jgi:hypothetical protein
MFVAAGSQFHWTKSYEEIMKAFLFSIDELFKHN